MSKQKEILYTYLSEELGSELNSIIKGWLADNMEKDPLNTILEECFEDKVRFSKPTLSTYRRLRKLEKQLGFPNIIAVKRPFPKFIAVRAAAVLVPVMVALGLGLYLLRPAPAADDARAIAQIAQNTVVAQEKDETAVPAEEPQSAVPVEKSPAGESRSRKKRKEAAVYDINITAAPGTHRHVTLPDNSTVLINSGGVLAFNSAGREAFLTGEAFFKVAKGSERPFRISTSNLMIDVTGTEFNVKALPGSDNTVVDLIKGSVNAHTASEKFRLKANDRLILSHRNGSSRISLTERTGWWNDPIVFESKTICQILEKLEEYYDIPIRGREEIAHDLQYSVKFEKMSRLEYILDILKEISPGFEFRKETTGITVNMRDVKIQ